MSDNCEQFKKELHLLSAKEMVEIERRLGNLLDYLNAPGDWGYDTIIGKLTNLLHELRMSLEVEIRNRDEVYRATVLSTDEVK